MKNRSIGLIILLFLLTIGFASVTTNLIINNNINISTKPDDFSVVFTSVSVDEGSTATISEDNKSIAYNTRELINVGDRTEIEYTIKNNSSQYDAKILLSLDLNEDIRSLFKITYIIFNDVDLTDITAKESKSGKIIIELIKPATFSGSVSMNILFDAIAVGREKIEYGTYTVRFNGNGSDTGSMNEQVITYDESTRLLSNQFVKSGYQMIGWTTDPNTNENYHPDNGEVLKLTESGNTIDLYAIWLKNDYDYTNNNYQTVNIPVNGTYKLETWGAQGYHLNTTYYGGYGAYSVGNISLNKGKQLYIFVGQKGNGGAAPSQMTTYQSYPNGGRGINGYGSASIYMGSGGGSTHISEINTIISRHSDLSKLLIVAGGGGASIYSSAWAGSGGNAGGYIGSNGIRLITDQGNWQAGTGGTQNSGGTYTLSNSNANAGLNGSFGTGGSANTSYYGAGGGGGYYGGAASYGSAGGGGAGYIANPSLTNKKMVCFNCRTSTATDTYTVSNTCHKATPTVDCAKEGNGYARITFISPNN